MYPVLLPIHSLLRWLVVVSIVLVLIRALYGWMAARPYTRTDALLRGVAGAAAHTQLLLGFVLYFKSPIVAYFRENFREALAYREMTFFGLVHISLMLIAIVVLTVGSSMGKRAASDRQKHRLIALFFLAGAILMFCAIPWPFSPLAQRPLWRSF